MDAVYRRGYFYPAWIACCLILFCCTAADAANQRTQNFIIQAPTPQLAAAVAEAAERYRRDLAIHWLGKPLPPWPRPCPIRVVAGPRLAAQGVTTYNPAPVRDFQMEVIGTPQRVLDSVLPHEITHTILATYFGRPLPRWADEGICTTVEHVAERRKHEAKLQEFLRSRRGIAMNQLFLLKEYPSDVLPMYAQGYSVCRFLISQKGPRTFIRFLEDYMQHPSWTDNIRRHYGYASLAELQQYWLSWVSAGSGDVALYAKTQYAKTQPAPNTTQSGGDVVLASGTQPETKNSRTQVVPATGNRATGYQASEMNLQSPNVNALALNAPDANRASDAIVAPDAAATTSDITAPVTNLTTIETVPGVSRSSSVELGPTPDTSAQTATAAIASEYQRQRTKNVAAQQPSGSTRLSLTDMPMIPPSIRLSGKYGVQTNRLMNNPAPRLRLATASGEGQRNSRPLTPAAGATSATTTGTATTIGTGPNRTAPAFSPILKYQTAHPQPEQQIPQSGQPAAGAPARNSSSENTQTLHDPSPRSQHAESGVRPVF